ncbi:MAG: exodeoxyribonuclease VII small subunit [Coriobacteriales bacterium]|jgi:exodeoxyribonuclease VII small subunit|nr:exodeoxyribonuclease VII small subunit [Coriobacteriales bacterium]
MDEKSSYGQLRERMEEIVVAVRSKDVPLEKSLDLYEEALRLGTRCAELIDRTDFTVEELELASGTNADADSEADAGADSEAETYADADSEADAYADADTYAEADSYTDAEADSYGDAEADIPVD